MTHTASTRVHLHIYDETNVKANCYAASSAGPQHAFADIQFGNEYLALFVDECNFAAFEANMLRSLAEIRTFFSEQKAMKDAKAAFRAKQLIDAATEQTEAVTA